MPTWSDEIDQILSDGISLHDLGTNNWALDRPAALAAIDHLGAMRVPILGGDVYRLENGAMRSLYDSWHCDRRLTETDSDFLERSIAQARNYVEKYPPAEQMLYFTLVPSN